MKHKKITSFRQNTSAILESSLRLSDAEFKIYYTLKAFYIEEARGLTISELIGICQCTDDLLSSLPKIHKMISLAFTVKDGLYFRKEWDSEIDRKHKRSASARKSANDRWNKPKIVERKTEENLNNWLEGGKND